MSLWACSWDWITVRWSETTLITKILVIEVFQRNLIKTNKIMLQIPNRFISNTFSNFQILIYWQDLENEISKGFSTFRPVIRKFCSSRCHNQIWYFFLDFWVQLSRLEGFHQIIKTFISNIGKLKHPKLHWQFIDINQKNKARAPKRWYQSQSMVTLWAILECDSTTNCLIKKKLI